MCTRKRTLMVWGMVAVALLVGVWGLPDTARPASAQVDPAEVVQEQVAALNAGDVEAVMEFYADDAVYVAIPLCAPVECVGKDAIRAAVAYTVANNVRVTIISSEVSGNTVTGFSELESEHTRTVGVDRVLVSFSVEVREGRISEYRAAVDPTDPQSVDFGAHAEANSIVVALGPGRDADQSPGWAMLTAYGDRTDVAIVLITSGPPGVLQPVHIHEGTCASLGAPAFSLEHMQGGRSGTAGVDISLSELQTGDYAIAVQKSEDEPEVYVACGDIPAAAPEAPPVEPAPAPEVVIAPAPAIAPLTGRGGLLPEEDGGIATWWYALVTGGALLVMIGLAGLRKARS